VELKEISFLSGIPTEIGGRCFTIERVGSG
jgi:hypothetical protein